MIQFTLNNMPTVKLVGKRISNKSWRYSNFKILYYEILFIYDGQGIFTINEEQYIVAKGDCILLKPKDTFSATSNEKFLLKYYVIHFEIFNPVRTTTKAEVIRTIESHLLLLNDSSNLFEMPQLDYKDILIMRFFKLDVSSERIFRILDYAIEERSNLDISSGLILSSYLCQILVLLTRQSLKELNLDIGIQRTENLPTLLKEIIYYIHNNYKSKITLTALSNDLNISSQYIIRQFKKYYSCTPMEYLTIYRLSIAKEHLKYTNMSIKEIAYDCGYDDQYHFSKTFKIKEGCSPSEYRQSVH